MSATRKPVDYITLGESMRQKEAIKKRLEMAEKELSEVYARNGSIIPTDVHLALFYPERKDSNDIYNELTGGYAHPNIEDAEHKDEHDVSDFYQKNLINMDFNEKTGKVEFSAPSPRFVYQIRTEKENKTIYSDVFGSYEAALDSLNKYIGIAIRWTEKSSYDESIKIIPIYGDYISKDGKPRVTGAIVKIKQCGDKEISERINILKRFVR